MSIADFLLARISEDETRAGSLLADTQDGYDINEYAERVLAECAAKLAIVEQLPPTRAERTKSQNAIIEVMAAVYKDHPDYQQEWAL